MKTKVQNIQITSVPMISTYSLLEGLSGSPQQVISGAKYCPRPIGGVRWEPHLAQVDEQQGSEGGLGSSLLHVIIRRQPIEHQHTQEHSVHLRVQLKAWPHHLPCSVDMVTCRHERMTECKNG